MMVNEKNTVVAKESPILPGDHLSKAKYTDVIERQLLDGDSDDEKIKLCVSSDVEMRKCQVMRDVAFSRDVRPLFVCVLKDQALCSDALRAGQVDAMVVEARNLGKYKLDELKPIMFEKFDEEDKFVVIADADISTGDIKKASL
jgi:Transferrin